MGFRAGSLASVAPLAAAALLCNLVALLRLQGGGGPGGGGGRGVLAPAPQDPPALRRRTAPASDAGPPPPPPPDGRFNGLPVRYRRTFEGGFHSTASCLGENFVDAPEERTSNSAWKYRSCHFRRLCFDLTDRTFVLFSSEEQAALREALDRAGERQFWPAGGATEGYAVAAGGHHPRFGGKDVALKWYPEFRDLSEVEGGGGENDTASAGYYLLPPEYVLVPWNSYHGFNPGHIITDDFLPIYTLLASFGLTDKQLAMIHIDLPLENAGQWWDSCQNHWKECEPYLERFLPLLGTELRETSTQHTATLTAADGGDPKSRYVCASHGAAGMGMYTDHGRKLHGNFEKDFEFTHNVGRAESFKNFRDWMVARLLGTNVEAKLRPPYRIVISSNSSTDPIRNVSLERHAAALERELGKKYPLDVRRVTPSDLTMAEQVTLAAGTSVFVTAAGGGASLAHFLPRGASVLLYFVEFPPDKKATTGQYNGWPMDWDTYNNFGYVRAHWLPIRRRGNRTSAEAAAVRDAEDLDVFVRMVDQELDLISHLYD
ncbi:hypothetical protein ACHAWF_008394 [Thalassiosira exigua]